MNRADLLHLVVDDLVELFDFGLLFFDLVGVINCLRRAWSCHLVLIECQKAWFQALWDES